MEINSTVSKKFIIMEFINEVGQTSRNEPRNEQLLGENRQFVIMEDFISSTYYENVVPRFESEDDDLVLFGVGGPA